MIGYREFHLKFEYGQLKPFPLHEGTGCAHNNERVASCSYDNVHPEGIPGDNCSCGYYGHYKPHAQALLVQGHRHTPTIFAVVFGYGKIVLHETGFRAERMAIWHFIIPKCICGREMRLTEWSGGRIHLACPQLIQPVSRISWRNLTSMAHRYKADILDTCPEYEVIDPLKVEGRSVEKQNIPFDEQVKLTYDKLQQVISQKPALIDCLRASWISAMRPPPTTPPPLPPKPYRVFRFNDMEYIWASDGSAYPKHVGMDKAKGQKP